MTTTEVIHRSCFIDYPTRADAIDAIIALSGGSPTPFILQSVTDFGDPDSWVYADGDLTPADYASGAVSVYFIIEADILTPEGEGAEAAFIAASGGEYTGS